MRVLFRFVCLLFVIGGVVGMSAHYVVAGPDFPYATNPAVLNKYDDVTGDRVFLFATFIEYDRDTRTATVVIGGGENARRLTVSDVDPIEVSPGGRVQVFGTLRPGNHIDAANVVVVNPSEDTTLYKYGLSAVGALLVLVGFARCWTVDPEKIAFTRR